MAQPKRPEPRLLRPPTPSPIRILIVDYTRRHLRDHNTHGRRFADHTRRRCVGTRHRDTASTPTLVPAHVHQHAHADTGRRSCCVRPIPW